MPENMFEINVKEVSDSVDKLPKLKENCVRAVHITVPEKVEEILVTGLDYKKYGMAMSTAKAWSDENQVEYGSNDPRFNKPGMKAVVLDIPNEEWKLHNRPERAPGMISAERIVGVVEANKNLSENQRG